MSVARHKAINNEVKFECILHLMNTITSATRITNKSTKVQEKYTLFFIYNLLGINAFQFLEGESDFLLSLGEPPWIFILRTRWPYMDFLIASLVLKRYIGSFLSNFSSSTGVYWSRNSSIDRWPPPTLMLILS